MSVLVALEGRQVPMQWIAPALRRTLKGICPWCDPAPRTPSLYVFVADGRFTCFGRCRKNGRLATDEQQRLLRLMR